MFLSDMAEAKQDLIEIRDFDADAIQDLVGFAYSSRLTLTVDNVQPLLYAACILQVELIARACCEYMKAHFHPSNCLAVRTFAESHNRVDLMDMADRYACEHFSEVVECEDFICVSPQHLKTLLASSDLNIQSETQVYNAAVKWLKANPKHHDVWLDQIMSQVSCCGPGWEVCWGSFLQARLSDLLCEEIRLCQCTTTRPQHPLAMKSNKSLSMAGPGPGSVCDQLVYRALYRSSTAFWKRSWILLRFCC